MREIRPSGSEGGGLEFNRFSLPLSSFALATASRVANPCFHRVQVAESQRPDTTRRRRRRRDESVGPIRDSVRTREKPPSRRPQRAHHMALRLFGAGTLWLSTSSVRGATISCTDNHDLARAMCPARPATLHLPLRLLQKPRCTWNPRSLITQPALY